MPDNVWTNQPYTATADGFLLYIYNTTRGLLQHATANIEEKGVIIGVVIQHAQHFCRKRSLFLTSAWLFN
jgi:hypothetical protein